MRADAVSGRVRRVLPGMIAVVVTYVYFLLFVQFAFLGLVERGAGNEAVPTTMLAMGAAGLVFSFLAGRMLGLRGSDRLLPVAMLGCGLAAGGSLLASGTIPLAAAAFAVGAFTALLTVSLAADLERRLGGGRFGLKVGIATGIAYAVCNVPVLFDAPAEVQTVFAAAVCVAGFVVSVTLGRAAVAGDGGPVSPESVFDTTGLGFASVVLAFLALIWTDSAAFRIIQETLELKGLTWGDPGRKALIGTTHLVAAAVGGHLLDRGVFRAQLLAAFALFVTAFTLLDRTGSSLAGPIYSAGISLYSVALVAFPSRVGDAPGRVPRRWRAAIVFGIAGWVGSALGVGMAQDLHRIPPVFLWGAGLVLAAGWIVSNPRPRQTLSRVWLLPLAFAVVALVVYLGHGVRPAPTGSENAVARGREVYVDEGCINCHSQYVRPHTIDVDRYGPARPFDPDAQPPLIGNRRQGPDLSNVGLRRPREWNRQHLIDPRRMTPGSRMPSYAYLFEDGSGRGDDLVLYLDSLGRERD